MIVKYGKNTVKMTQNDDFSKFSKIDFSITVQDMKMGVGPGENTSLGHVLK